MPGGCQDGFNDRGHRLDALKPGDSQLDQLENLAAGVKNIFRKAFPRLWGCPEKARENFCPDSI